MKYVALLGFLYWFVPNAAALVGGTPAKGHPSVFIWTSASGPLYSSYCTASKLTKNKFITAAHCALEYTAADDFSYRQIWSFSPDFEPGRKIQLSFARSVGAQTPAEWLTLKKVHFLPALESALLSCLKKGTRTPLPDVAIIEVENPATAPSFASAPVIRVSLRKVYPGDPITLLGFGNQDEDDESDAVLKRGSNAAFPIALLRPFLADTPVSRDGAPPAALMFGAPGFLTQQRFPSLGSGDSGGPVLDARTGELVGINSDGYCPVYKEDCQKAGNSIFARVDASAEGSPGNWIRKLQSETELVLH